MEIPVDISAEVAIDEENVRDMDAIVDRLTVHRKHEKAIKAAIAAALLVGDGLLQIHVEKATPRAAADAFYRGLWRNASLRLRRHRARVLHVHNNPEAASPHVRRTRRGQAHPSGTPSFPIRSGSIRAGCFVREAFSANPDTWMGGSWPAWRARSILARRTMERAARCCASRDPVRHRAAQGACRDAAGGYDQAAGVERHEVAFTVSPGESSGTTGVIGNAGEANSRTGRAARQGRRWNTPVPTATARLRVAPDIHHRRRRSSTTAGCTSTSFHESSAR
ncbi:MAG: hypothetical protein U0163_09325 [Gemmatimonadaceae bacterium]